MILFKSIKPATKFKSSVFRASAAKTAERIAPLMEKDLLAPTKTWKAADIPVFKRKVSVGNAAGGSLAKKATGSASGVSIEVTTDSEIYGYLDEGTKVRFATMTSNFQPKTKVNSLRASRGRGGVAFVNRKRPRPGIKARGFTKLVRAKWAPQFRKEMQAALAAAAKLSGHSTT